MGLGNFFAIGTSYTGVASSSGELKLYYWDSNNYDNSESVTVTIAAVPEPSAWAMIVLGFAGVGFMAYRRSRKDQSLALTAA